MDDYRAGGGIAVGSDVLNRTARRDEVSGFLEVFDQTPEVEAVGLVSATALPSGCATDEVVAYFEHTLPEQIHRAGPLDAVCFALHGANSAASVLDLDGHILQVIRDVLGDTTPIICTLDHHAIVTKQMLSLCDAFFAYRTHPHIDLVETGIRAARTLVNQLQGRCHPVVRHRRIPLLLTPPDEGTHSGEMKALFDTLSSWDKIDGVLGCSLCCSYPWQDVPEQGWTAIAITDDDIPLADRLVDQLAEQAWAARHQLLPEAMLTPEQAIRKAIAVAGCPVVITDSADTIGSGAPGDTTDLLHKLIEMRHQIDGLILIHLPDPQAIAAVKAHGQDDPVTVEVGGKRDQRYSQPPCLLTAKVLCITEGPIEDEGRFTTSPTVEVGSIVCLGVDNVRVVLTEQVIMGPQPSVFRKVGIDPFSAKIVALKTGVGFKATYSHVAKAAFPADCNGAASYNLNRYRYKNIPRPMYPLDTDFTWHPDETYDTAHP